MLTPAPKRRDPDQKPEPQPRPKAKIRVRNLGTGRNAGVPVPASGQYHTSMRLDDDDKRRLRELAHKRYLRDGIKHTMSSIARQLIREAATKEGIK